MPVTKFGLWSSKSRPVEPMVNSRNATFGSTSRRRNAGNGFIGASLDRRAGEVEHDVSRRRPRPSGRWRTRATSSSVAAMPSTAPTATASLGGDDRASRDGRDGPVDRPWRASAIAVILAIASFRTLSPSVPGMSLPSPSTGDAAPMLRAGRHQGDVGGEGDERPGARREAAGRRDPDDRRDAALEERRRRSRCVASRLPPGVLSLITTAAAPASAAACDVVSRGTRP